MNPLTTEISASTNRETSDVRLLLNGKSNTASVSPNVKEGLKKVLKPENDLK